MKASSPPTQFSLPPPPDFYCSPPHHHRHHYISPLSVYHHHHSFYCVPFSTTTTRFLLPPPSPPPPCPLHFSPFRLPPPPNFERCSPPSPLSSPRGVLRQQILIRGGSAQRSNPLPPFIYHFSRKWYSFGIPPIDKWYPFPC